MVAHRKIQLAERGARVDFDAISSAELRAIKRAWEKAHPQQACLVGRRSLLFVDAQDVPPFEEEPEAGAGAAKTVELRVDEEHGPDLNEVLLTSATSRAEFIEEIAGWDLRAEFAGFLPGFVYLSGVPERWRLPRRSAPRPRVARGTFAIAHDMAGFYPADSPGGWNLLGRTDAIFWRPDAARPALLEPGDRVILRVVDRPLVFETSSRSAATVSLTSVVEAGQLLLLVPPARTQRLRHGIAAGGAFDARAAAWADRACGNAARTAQLEAALVGPTLRFHRPAVVAWSGADVEAELDCSRVSGSVVEVKENGVLRFGALRDGARLNIAVRGGFEELGGMYELEPLRLQSGDTVGFAGGEVLTPRLVSASREDRHSISIAPGADAAPDELWSALRGEQWSVSDASRRGVRLTCRRTIPSAPSQLDSAPTLFGTIQWHPDGSLTVLGVDHPTTGGYAQPAIVHARDLWKLGQLRAGEKVTFTL